MQIAISFYICPFFFYVHESMQIVVVFLEITV